MRLSNKHFIILFMLLALQLQSFPAMALLLCQDNLPTRLTNHQLSHAKSHINQQSDQQSDLSECDDCIFCHASFNFCTPLNNPSLNLKLSSTIFLISIPHFYQFISELPQRPPKNSL